MIIVLMTLASLGLIAFQFYWVNNAIRINQERFDQNVYQALSSTVAQLEQSETSDALFSNLARDSALQKSLFEKIEPIQLPDHSRLVRRNRTSIVDTMLQVQAPAVSATFKRMLESRGVEIGAFKELEEFFTYMTPKLASNLFTPDEMEILLQEKERQFRYRDSLDKLPKQHIQSTVQYYTEMVPEINISQDFMEKIQKANLKIAFFNRVWEEMAEGQQAILDRMDTAQVRKMVKGELLDRNISEDFELGLLRDDMRFLPIGQVKEQFPLIQKGTQAKLFPNDILSKNNYLYIYFPEKRTHVIKEVWLPISSSILFILVIIFCFIYAIRVIFRQKALSDTKNDFINNMTHEFKTPLATVSLAVEALQDPELSTKDKFRTRYLGIIKDENKRLVAQVENVLQAAALDKNDFKLKIENLNLSEILESTVDHFGLQVEKKGGQITFTNNLEDPFLEGDLFHLTHIFNNLLDNANKYSPNTPFITVEAHDATDSVYVQIKDEGIGMSKDAQRKIFDKFYRVPTGNVHDVKGFGLGLSYVKTMLEAHKGGIQVSSEPGKGSTFTINLPKKQ